MNDKLYDALEVCLQALEAGADIESVLKRYPQMADELRPILETSIQAQTLSSVPSVSKAVMQRGRARVLGHASEMREAAGKTRRFRLSLPRLATTLALVLIIMLSGTGLVRASSGALPGDELYPVKRTWEDVRLTFVLDDESREELENEFEDERMEEISELLEEGRHETVMFAGMVTQIDGDQWLVSGIKVLINSDTQLPTEQVTQDASIAVEGRTNVQGFVEADRVELLEPGILLVPYEPVEQEDLEKEVGPENFESSADEEDSIKPYNAEDNSEDEDEFDSEDAIESSGRDNENSDDSGEDKLGDDDDDDESEDEHESDDD